jgi:hypothetical protein
MTDGLHPNEIDLLRIGKIGRKALGEEARTLGNAHIEAWNEQVNRQYRGMERLRERVTGENAE